MLLTILLQVVAADVLGKAGIALSAAIAALAAGYGIGKIGSAATESIARQPEAGGSIRSSMIIVAAMIEGAALFAIIVCLSAPSAPIAVMRSTTSALGSTISLRCSCSLDERLIARVCTVRQSGPSFSISSME